MSIAICQFTANEMSEAPFLDEELREWNKIFVGKAPEYNGELHIAADGMPIIHDLSPLAERFSKLDAKGQQDELTVSANDGFRKSTAVTDDLVEVHQDNVTRFRLEAGLSILMAGASCVMGVPSVSSLFVNAAQASHAIYSSFRSHKKISDCQQEYRL